MQQERPARRLIRTTLVMGGASASTLLIGVVRIKLLAVLLGPAGVGLLSLYNSVMATANALFGAGLGFSGVKHIAQAQDDQEAARRAQASLWYASFALGIAGAASIWLLREPMSRWILGDTSHAREIGWLGIGVVFSLVASSQIAVLQGQRRIRELAKVQVMSALLASVAAVLIVLWFAGDGVLLAVLAGPIVAAVIGFVCLRSDKGEGLRFASLRAHLGEFRAMLTLGMLFMLNSVLAQVAEIWVRAAIGRELGLEAVGHYQAAWVISQTYLGMVLAALSTDFYPRIADAVRRGANVGLLVDEQIAGAFVLTPPLILITMAFAPMIVPLLFSDGFTGTLQVLRWQLLGDVLRVACVPLIYVLAVHERNLLYLVIPATWHVVYVLGILYAIPRFGLEGAGTAYLIGNAAYLVAALWAVSASTSVRLSRPTAAMGVAALTIAVVTRVVLDWDLRLGMAVGGACALCWVMWHAVRLIRSIKGR